MILSPQETQQLLEVINASQGQDGTAVTFMVGEGERGQFGSIAIRAAAPSKNGGGADGRQFTPAAAAKPTFGGGYAPKKVAFKPKTVIGKWR